MQYASALPVIYCLFIALFSMQCQQPGQTDSTTTTGSNITQYEPAPVALNWRVVSHLNGKDTFTSELTLTNQSTEPLQNSGWTLYFNFIRMIDAASMPATVTLTHINGDFFKLEPATSFPTLAQNESVVLSFESSNWAVKKSDAPAGFYMVYLDESGEEMKPQPITQYTVSDFDTPAQTMRNASDEVPVPTPASRFAENANLELLPASELPPVVPTPGNWSWGDGTVTINGSTQIRYAPGLKREAELLAENLVSVLGKTLETLEGEEQAANSILLTLSESTNNSAGAYTLQADADLGVHISGMDAAGVFYGIQTLRGLFAPEVYAPATNAVAIPAIQISDVPRFGYRGMHLDVSRNFHSKESILKMLDLMAFYKLNKFHFHLTDDEGWRLAIEGLPELTEVGSRRGHTLDESTSLYPSLGSGPDPENSYGSGYYSRQDFVEILRFARDRHIEVIPEIDLPGHARAAIRSMEARFQRLAAAGNEAAASAFRLTHPQDASTYSSVQMWNDNVVDVCMPSTYTFIEHVTDDLMKMYEEAGTPLRTLHIGNDEVPHGAWEDSPACATLSTNAYNSYFLEKVHEILSSRNLTLAGWEEIALIESEVNGAVQKVPNREFADKNFQPYVWNAVWGWGSEGTAYQLANAGYKIVMSNATNLYFDFAYDKDPEEPGFYWAGFSNAKKTFAFNPFDLYQNASTSLFGQTINPATTYRDYPRLTDAGKQNILGIQGQLWSETVKGPALLEYQLFPKMLGLAERAWAAAPAWFSESNASVRREAEARGWNVFANKLGQHELPRLDYQSNVGYRIPPPGARLNGNKLEANVAFPGMQIRYTTEDRDPTINDALYTTPINFEGLIRLRAFSAGGRSSRTISIGS